MMRFILCLLAASLFADLARADPPKIDRTIAKEPVYQTKTQKYALLVFGPDARDRVWLVLDGETLYVDRNGNGDLTEPGEKVAAEKNVGGNSAANGYSFDVGALNVGGRTHKGLSVSFIPLKVYSAGWRSRRPEVTAALAKDPKAAVARVSLDVDFPGMKGGGIDGRVTCSAAAFDLNGVLQFADKSAEAPVIHFGGPLQVTFFGEVPSLRVGREEDLYLVVGTPGIGPGTFAMINYQDAIPEGARAIAAMTLPPVKAGAPPVTEKFELKHRC
jgi:hypothetical protein